MTPTAHDSAAPHGVGYGQSGDGPVVMLVHSSVSGRRPWSSLTSALEDRHLRADVRRYFELAVRVDVGYTALASLRLMNGERRSGESTDGSVCP